MDSYVIESYRIFYNKQGKRYI